MEVEAAARRYDPIGREREREVREREVREREYREREARGEREREREAQMMEGRYASSPEAMRSRAVTQQQQGPPPPPPPPVYPAGVANARASESPRMVEAQARARVRAPRAPGSGGGSVSSSNGSNGGHATPAGPKIQEIEVASPGLSGEQQKKERKRRAPRRGKEDTPQPQQGLIAQRQDSHYSMAEYRLKTGSQGSPEPMGSNGSGSGSANRSAQPSPTNSIHLPPSREVDEDYDEGVADALLHMSKTPTYRNSGPSDPRSFGPPLVNGPGLSHSPPSGGRLPTQSSPHSMSKHPAMMHQPGRPSPPLNKRPLSPGPDDMQTESKRSRVGSMSRHVPSPTAANATSSTRPSPIPFRQQPTSHSPEIRQGEPASVGPAQNHSYPPSPALPTMLPPHPRPIGHAGLASQGQQAPPPPPPSVAPGVPSNTRSPPNTTSPPMEDRDVRMRDSRSNSPSASRLPAKREIVLHAARSPPGSVASGTGQKGTPSPASSHGSHSKLS